MSYSSWKWLIISYVLQYLVQSLKFSKSAEQMHCFKLPIISIVFRHKEFNKKYLKSLTTLHNTVTEKVSQVLFIAIVFLH